MIPQIVTKFKSVLDHHIKTLRSRLKEELDTQFLGFQSVIRTFRNQAGHPTGKVPGREQTYVLFQLYVSYCKKLYRMREYFAQAP